MRPVFGILFLAIALAWGCDNMRDGNRFKPYEESSFFKDGSSSRPLVEGTVARGMLREDDHLYRARVNGKIAETFPMEVDEKVLRRGQQRYDIYCSVCHDRLGYGQGMVVRRGFNQPASFHEDRLRQAPVGYFFDVMTHGFGVMSDYSAEINPADRWAIAAYIRVLQESQNVPYQELSEAEKQELLN